MSVRAIYIRPEPFGVGFDIMIEPAPEWTNLNRERPTHREAVRYANGIRAVHGWRVVDETGDAINAALGITWAHLRGRLFLVSLKGLQNNELCTFDQAGRMHTTPRWKSVLATVRRLGATHVVLDNVAHLFAGSEIVRNQVAAFVGLLDRLAVEINGGVILLGQARDLPAGFPLDARQTRKLARLAGAFPAVDRDPAVPFDAYVQLMRVPPEDRAAQLAIARAERWGVKQATAVATRRRHETAAFEDDDPERLATHVYRAWNRAPAEIRRHAWDLLQSAAASGFTLVDEEEPVYA